MDDEQLLVNLQDDGELAPIFQGVYEMREILPPDQFWKLVAGHWKLHHDSLALQLKGQESAKLSQTTTTPKATATPPTESTTSVQPTPDSQTAPSFNIESLLQPQAATVSEVDIQPQQPVVRTVTNGSNLLSTGRALTPAETFLQLLKNPIGVVHLKRYLERDGQPSDLLFWVEVEKFRTSSHTPAALKTHGKKICDKFLEISAPSKVSIALTPAKLKKLHEELAADLPDTLMFSEIQGQVLEKLQRDDMGPFLRSSFYTEYLQLDRSRKTGVFSPVALPRYLLEPITFEKLLHSPPAILYFKRFVQQEHSEENLLFFLEVEKYHAVDKSALSAAAQHIHKKFLGAEATMPLNLPAGAQDSIAQLNLENPSVDAFDELQRLIFSLMKEDSYPRYLASAHYKEFAEKFSPA